MRVGDVCEVEKAANPPGDDVWLLNLDAIERDTGRVLSIQYVSQGDLGSSTVAFSADAVLYSKLRPNLNKVVVPAMAGIATSEILPLRASEEKLDRTYLACFLRSRPFVAYAVASTVGAKMPRVKRKTVLDCMIPLPSLSSQATIAEQLTSITATMGLCEDYIAKLDDLVKSRFVEMFGDPVSNTMDWEISTIKETAVTYGDGPFGSNLKSSDYVDEGVRVIRLGNILAGSFSERDRSFVSFEKYERLKKYECKPGEVVIGTLGDPLLRACIVPDFGVPSIHKADCMYYETDKSLSLIHI